MNTKYYEPHGSDFGGRFGSTQVVPNLGQGEAGVVHDLHAVAAQPVLNQDVHVGDDQVGLDAAHHAQQGQGASRLLGGDVGHHFGENLPHNLKK